MEIGLALLVFVCMTALLYVLLSLKITRQVDAQMKEFYKTRIHADMQEFYRIMESYAAMFESRIQSFRTLVERNEAAAPVRQSKLEAVEEHVLVEEPPAPLTKHVRADTRKSQKEKSKVTAKPITKGAKQKAPVAAAKAPVKPLASKKNSHVPQATKPKPQPAQVPPQRIQASTVRTAMPSPEMQETNIGTDDTAIAEELMKDLFAQDEVKFAAQNKVAPPAMPAKAIPVAETEGEKTMAKFLSRLGKAIEPMVFGEKNESPKATEVTPAQPVAVAVPTPQATNFTEVLRRAEQIKAEKKAERERAEVEARAEFYAGGDSFKNTENARQTVPEPPPRIAVRPQPEVVSVSPRPAPPVESGRNVLAVKELDQHTINFLIDSLVNDTGYRKQALRALTENNIALTDIARLSKIDIGELELMRQLGRF
jgi:hypothetical protein